MNYRITPFVTGQKYSLELEEFEPKDGYELFIKVFCKFIGEEFLDWYRGIAEGIGHITYRDYKLLIYWTDFPFALSFDCRDQAMAQELETRLEAFFSKP